MRNSNIYTARFTVLLGLISILSSGRRLMASGYEFEGVGAKEVSRAGAAIADSNDWTAMYWNPANLAPAVNGRKQIGLELFGGSAYGKDSNSLSSLPGLGARFSKNKSDSSFILGAFGGVIPLGKKVGLGFGFYTPLLQGVDFSDTSNDTPPVHLDYKGSATILTWNISSGIELTPRCFIGVGLNALYGRLKVESKITNFPFAGNDITSDQDGDGWALEGIFGARFEATPKLTVGAVARSGADVALQGDARVNTTLLPSESNHFRFELRHPPTSGVGLSYRPKKTVALNADFTQTYWHRFSNALDFDSNGTFLADSGNTFNWKDSWKLRFGTEVATTEKTHLLGGYSFDHAAMDSGSVDFANAIDVPMNRLYAGASHQWDEKWESVLGMVYGYGRRKDNGVTHQLSGWQLMLETRFTY